MNKDPEANAERYEWENFDRFEEIEAEMMDELAPSEFDSEAMDYETRLLLDEVSVEVPEM